MAQSERPLHLMDPTGRFSSRASAYAKWRPDYPEAAIELALEGFAPSPNLVIADVGAGTGISSQMLARRGVRVLAVEPNDGMRAAGEALEGVRWIAAPAETTGLEDGSVDVVAAFQAFHWFEPERALREFHRILRPGGRLVVVWNRRDRGDPFTAAYSEVISRHANQHPAEERAGAADPLRSSGWFSPAEELTVPHQQRLPLEGLLGRAKSTSYLPGEGEAHRRLVEDLVAVHRQHADADGYVALVYRTEVYRCARHSDTA